jgi:retron-type reverse transcriptase
MVEVLNAIYEEDFLGFSYGFRPGRGPHDALDALAVGIGNTRVNWVLDANRARGIIGKGQVLPYTHRGRIGGLPPMD